MAIPEENVMGVNKIEETDEYQDFVHVRWILRTKILMRLIQVFVLIIIGGPYKESEIKT